MATRRRTTTKRTSTTTRRRTTKAADLNNDGIVTQEEAQTLNSILKHSTQSRLAYISIWSMVFITLFLFLPVFTDERIKSLGDLLPIFYLGNASIVGAYMGATAYMSAKLNGK